jgi:2-dehydro-3-deoxygluconokinase
MPDRLDVACAGQTTWTVEVATARQRPSGATGAALVLARAGLRVGLATVLPDDPLGHETRARLAHAAIDVEGVVLSPAPRRIVLAERASIREEARPIVVPEAWAPRVLLISGLAPVLERRDMGERASPDRDSDAIDIGGMAHAAALCRAARAGRRGGATVVVDLDVRWRLWQGRDPRAIAMVVREADVVWCSVEDLLGLGLDSSAVHAAMRADAVLLVHEGNARVRATARFGEIVIEPPPGFARPTLEDDAVMASLCAELARSGIQATETDWHRALARAHRSALRSALPR